MVDGQMGRKAKGDLGNVMYWGLLILIFLLPLAYSPISFSGFTLAKATLLIIATSALALLWVGKIAISNRVDFKRRFLDLPILGFALVAILSTIFSVNPLFSLIGTYPRNEGLLTLISYVLVYFLTTNFVDNEQKAYALLEIILLSAIPVIILGILQHFGIDWFVWMLGLFGLTPAFGGNLSFSTLGNPIFYGAFLVLVIPIATSFLLVWQGRGRKLFYGVTLSLALIALLLTESRGAWVAGLTGLLFFLALTPRKILWKSRWSLLAAIFLGLVMFMLVSATSPSSPAERVVSAFKPQGSAAIRFELWESSLKLFTQRPVLGYGLETFKSVFPQFRSSLLMKEIRVADRPHNQLIYIATSAGLLGLVVFLWVVVSCFGVGLRYYHQIKKQSAGLIFLGILAALLGYLVQEQFAMSFPGVTPIFFALMGLLAGMVTSRRKEPPGEDNLPDGSQETRQLRLPIFKVSLLRITSVLWMFLLLLGIIFSARFFAADYFYRQGEVQKGHSQHIAAIENFREAVELNPATSEYRRALAESYFEGAKQTHDQSWLSEAIETYGDGIKFDSFDKDMWVGLGDIYLYQSSYQEAITTYRRALDVYPNLAPAYWGLGDTYIQLGQYDRALGEIKKALAITPEHTGVLYSLALIYERKGMSDKAKQIYQKVLNLNPHYEKAQGGLERLRK